MGLNARLRTNPKKPLGKRQLGLTAIVLFDLYTHLTQQLNQKKVTNRSGKPLRLRGREADGRHEFVVMRKKTVSKNLFAFFNAL